MTIRHRTDLKNEPYRRADGVRRSQRKRVEMELTGEGEGNSLQIFL